jgi:MSHA pilin protein MshA
MKMLKNQKGFTLIELVLVIVVLGILAAVATVQFGTVITDAKISAVDGAKGPFAAQLALSINTLKALPTLAQFGTNVHAMTTISGGVFKGAYVVGTGTFTVNTGNALCAAGDGNYTTTGTYVAATGALTFSNTAAC